MKINQLSVKCHIETSHLFCSARQMETESLGFFRKVYFFRKRQLFSVRASRKMSAKILNFKICNFIKGIAA